MQTAKTATLVLFGFPSTEARLEVLERSTAWRFTRCAGFAVGGLALAPVVGLLPPHAPWAIGALAAGGVMAFRSWTERFTVLSLEGSCPKCGGRVSLSKPTRLRPSQTVPCPGCNHDAQMVVTDDPASPNQEDA